MIDFNDLLLAPFLIVIAGAVALPVTSLLLRRYRRSVVALMSARGEQTQQVGGQHPTVAPGTPPAGRLRRTLTRRLAAHVAITVAAGLFIGVTYALLFAVWNDLEYDPVQLAFLVIMFSWPIVPGIWIATDGDRRWTTAALAIYLVVTLALPATTNAGALTGLVAWLWFNGLPTAVAAVFFTRSFRAIGICVLGVTLAALLGSLTLVSTLETDAVARLAVEIGFSAGLRDAGLVLAAVAVGGFLVAGVIGWWILARLGRSYSRHRFSDHMLLLGSLCFVFCIDYVAVVAGADLRALAVGLLLFVSLAIGSVMAYRVLIRPRHQPETLLLLRVFDHDDGPTLLNRIAARWRFVGPVRLIAGPDLATSTIEPDEFLTFMSGRLRRLFIDSPGRLEERLVELDWKTDPDGRFRLDEFFCFDTTWRATVDALISRSQAVLLDLRGFNEDRSGAADELSLLGRRGVFDRTVVIVNQNTDIHLVDSIVAGSSTDRPTVVSVLGSDAAEAVQVLLEHARAPSPARR